MSGFIGGLGLSAIPSVPFHPGLRTGTVYYQSAVSTPSNATSAMTANVAYYQPFCLPGMVIDRIGIETTVGSGNARLGIYSDLNGMPYQLILDAGILSVAGAAVNEISLATPLYLPQAWVWGCIIYSGTPTVRSGGAAINQFLLGVETVGATPSKALIGIQAYGPLPAVADVSILVGSTSAGLMFFRKTA